MLNRTSISQPIPYKYKYFRTKKLIPSVLIFIGLTCITIVLYPIISYYTYKLIYPDIELISPVDTSVYPQPIIAGNSVIDLDRYSDASSWFTNTTVLSKPVESDIKFFSISIPEIDVFNTLVEVNGLDLKKNAIHYPGTPLPGQFGNSVIFGHSSLPQFFHSNDPLTIFNPLLKAEIGNKLNIIFGNFEYIYQINKITEVGPDQIEVLAQDYAKREITLITCVPLGTYWHRLVVRAELIK